MLSNGRFCLSLAAAALFFVLWLVIPKNSDQGLASFDTLANNAIPFLQSLVYPLLPLFIFSSSSVMPLVVMGVAIIGLLFAAAAVAGAKRLWLFGLAWFGLSILPALLFLSSDYLYGSPRLHYLPAVGIALLLALPVLALARRMPRQIGPAPSPLARPAVYAGHRPAAALIHPLRA